MNSRQRLARAISLDEPDRVPVFPMAIGWPARLVGATQRQYYTDPAVMAAAQIEAVRRLRWDAVLCGSGVWRLHPLRPDAVGQEEDEDPSLRAVIVAEPAHLARLTVPDFAADPFASVPLRAIRRLRAALGPDFPIWLGVDSPWQYACLMRGVQGFMMETIDRPEFVDELVAFGYEAMAALARAGVAAGAEIYLMDALASPNQISPNTYRRWAQPYERRMAELVHSLGARQILHICGDTTRNLEDMAGTGSDVLEIDSAVTMAKAKERVGDRVCLKGNVDPVGTLLQGTPEAVEAECRAIIAAAGRGGGLILSSGCQIPRDTTVENVHALTAAAERWGWRG